MLWKREPKEIKGEIHETVKDMTGKVLVHIEKHGRNVSIKVRSRVDGNVLFNCEYQTKQSERPAYYDAERIADVFIQSNGYYTDKILSNIELPYVGNANKRMR